MTSGIYQIRNLENGKVYIGQSINIDRRKSEHLRSVRKGTHYNDYLQKAYIKYGEESFSFEVIELCDKRELNDRERFWINKYRSTDKRKGYNLQTGGDRRELSEYSRNKMSKTRKERIRKGLIKPVGKKWTDETRKKVLASLAKYYGNKESRIKLSKATSKIDYETVTKIKVVLKDDLEIAPEDIAKRYGVSVNSVNHIINMASHDYVLSEYNYVIKNRKVILEKRKNKTVIRMYRDGCSYQEIGTVVGLHHRNVIRRVNAIKTIHDDRCRLNVIKRAARKKTSLVRTLHSMGYNDIQSSRLLNASRSYIWNIRTGSLLKDYEDVNQVRAKVKPFNYKIGKVKTDELIIENDRQLVFAF